MRTRMLLQSIIVKLIVRLFITLWGIKQIFVPMNRMLLANMFVYFFQRGEEGHGDITKKNNKIIKCSSSALTSEDPHPFYFRHPLYTAVMHLT